MFGVFQEFVPVVKATDFTHRGLGTQQVEEILRKELPDANIIRIDRDTVSGKTKKRG